MDIVSQRITNTLFLDRVARAVLGKATSGVSVGGGASRIHLLDGNGANQARSSDIFNHFNTLQLSVEGAATREGETAPVIRCQDGAIALDSEMGYLVLLDGEVYAQGRDSLIKGELSLTLSSPAAGTYDIFVFRLRGNFASASTRIHVREEI